MLGARGVDIAMVCEEAEVALPFETVHKAKLVLTDELIAASQQAEDRQDGEGRSAED